MQDLTLDPAVLESALSVGAASLFSNPGALDLTDAVDDAAPDGSISYRKDLCDEAAIAAHLERGKVADALAVIAHLAEIPRPMVIKAYGAPQFDPLLFIARALGFGWPTFEALLKAKTGGPLPQTLYDSAHAGFHALSLSTAQRVMKFITVRSAI